MLKRLNSMPMSSMAFLLISWYLLAYSSGVMLCFSAETVMGVPCWSEPPTMRTSLPMRRLYLLNMSGGRSDPARCPRWMGPFE